MAFETSLHRLESVARLTISLIDARSGKAIFSEVLDEPANDSAAALEARLAGRLASAVSATFSGSHGTPGATKPEAYAAWLRGSYYFGQREAHSFDKAIQQFSEATSLDPKSASAWAALADAWIMKSASAGSWKEHNAETLRALDRALELDPGHPGTNSSFALLHFSRDYDFARARYFYLRALERDPQFLRALHSLGEMDVLAGKGREGIARMHRAEALAPAFAQLQRDLCVSYLYIGDFGSALNHCENALKLDQGPDSVNRMVYFLTLAKSTKWADAARLRTLAPRVTDAAALACAATALGDTELAKRAHRELAGPGVLPAFRSIGETCLGNTDAALDALERGLAARNPAVNSVLVNPFWAPLRSHPRFRAVAAHARVGELH